MLFLVLFMLGESESTNNSYRLIIYSMQQKEYKPKKSFYRRSDWMKALILHIYV